MYPDVDFVLTQKKQADIELKVITENLNSKSKQEQFRIISEKSGLQIVSDSDRGVLNGVYRLLENLDCGFFIGGDVLPKAKKWDGFKTSWNTEDYPIVNDRFLFNWHNFLSGCTGWELNDWKLWINQANKMGYNGIMVHAYGNNPMFSYNYLGETKATGYFNSSSNGRDWGNQHINDVRRITGGELFKNAVYGSKPSLVKDSLKDIEASKLMYNAFQYAEKCGTKIIFSLDFDTWMSHPQNIISKMPKESIFKINGYLTPNPDHPEGYKYYKHQIKELLKKYPQIDEITAWSRSANNKVNSNLGTIWLAFKYEDFPAKWKKEYDSILEQNTSVKRNLKSSGLFAFSKIVRALKKATFEINPNVQVGYGSWNFHWLHYADVFMPTDICFRPLDATVDFEKEKRAKELTQVNIERKISPIVWAHHDDFAYVGRPYRPYKNLSDKIKDRNLNGLGVIHWTTHPLDLYFSGTAKQLWNNTQNQTLEKNIEGYVRARFGKNTKELIDYYIKWMKTGPIFGRETSDHFIDLGKLHWKSKLAPWNQLITEANDRIKLLDRVPVLDRNSYYEYQLAMEKFYISFFENQDKFTKSYHLLQKGDVQKSRDVIKETNPDVTIAKFLDAIKLIDYTQGEKALVLSLNTRWKTDFLNLKQCVGLEPVRIKFSPTKHDSLAQMPGKNTYQIDDAGNWWACFWKKELPLSNFKIIKDKAYLVGKKIDFNLTSIHGQDLIEGNYRINIDGEHIEGVECLFYEKDKLVFKEKIPQNKTITFSKGKEALRMILRSKKEIKIEKIRIDLNKK